MRIHFFSTILAVFGAISCEHFSVNDTRVYGVCSRPNLPPNARIRFVSAEKVKFSENETIYVLCEENQFPHHAQRRICQHGRWRGSPARCGKSVSVNVNKLTAHTCGQRLKPALSLALNQSEDSPYPLPINSFHYSRVNESVNLSVLGSNCYRWLIQFEEPLEIAFLLIDFSLRKESDEVEKPNVTVDVPHRNCKLQTTSYQSIQQDDVFGNYFFCNLNTSLIQSVNDSRMKSDYFELTVTTNTTRVMSLEAVFVGETYKKAKHGKSLTTDCGKIEIQRTGVMEQVELGHVKVFCNDSFQNTAGHNLKHRFECDVNGEWRGEWPECVPKRSCSKEELIEGLDSSIIIERVGNVFYTNSTQWFPIEHSWVHYACATFDSILVGKKERVCSGGKWTNHIPHCTGAQSNLTIIIIILIILVFLITIFSLIVYLSIKFHTKKIHRKLEVTKSELEATALNKQISQDYYTDIGLETIYEDCKEVYAIPSYSDDCARYESGPRGIGLEPEYLTMTEGFPLPPLPVRQPETVEYSNL